MEVKVRTKKGEKKVSQLSDKIRLSHIFFEQKRGRIKNFLSATEVHTNLVRMVYSMRLAVVCFDQNTSVLHIRLWWLSGLICHASNSSRDRR